MHACYIALYTLIPIFIIGVYLAYVNGIIEASVVYVAKKVSKAPNNGWKPSQRHQEMVRKYYPILELFGVVKNHGYLASTSNLWGN